MGSLSNLYISQSYQSLIHLGSDTTITTASVQLQDGFGNGTGVFVNSLGNVFLSGSLTASLTEGYAWVGDGNNRTKLVATSSFVGGGTDLTSLNAFTSSQNTKNSTLASYTGSNDTKWNTLGGQTGSYVTSAITASSLVTASVNLNTITFTKGNGTTFAVTVNTGSAGGTTDISSLNAFTSSQETKNATLGGLTGSFATTGSNTFTGPNTFNQQVDIKNASGILLYSNTNNPLEANGIRNESGSLLVVKLGTANTVDLQNLSLLVSGTFTSSLQQGYVWVGDSSGKTTTVATSSFGGATPAGTISSSAQITSLGFVSSSVTASSLVTASFSGNTLTFTKGDASTFGVVIPDVSGSTIPAGTVSSSAQILAYNVFATTGSNTFIGNQTLTGSLFVSGNINMVNGADIVTHHVKAPAANGVEIQTNTGGVVALFGAGGSLGTTFYGQINATSISASSINGLGDPLAFSTSVDSRLDSLEGVSGSFTTTASFNSYTSSNDAKVNSLIAVTGSYATTGSNTFTGDQTLTDASGNFITLTDTSGSLMLVAKGFTSASLHLSASAAGIGNLIFKTNNNTPDTIISGSNNIFLNPAAPTAGFKRYFGGSGNIVLQTAAPQITGSMGFSPTMNNNYWGGSGVLSMRGPASSSAWTISNNVGTNSSNWTIGTAAGTPANQLISGFTANSNVGSIFPAITAYKTPLSASMAFTNNNGSGQISMNCDSSSISFVNNTTAGPTTINNSYFPTTVNSNAGVNLTNNTIFGSSTILNASGSDTTFVGVSPRGASNNLIGGYSTIGLVLNGDNSSLNSSAIIGGGLIVTGSNSKVAGATANNDFGSAFFGRWNAQDGNRAISGPTVFAVGTGTSTTRKTGFLIDSGSNTYVEGSLNVSGSTSLTGSLTLNGSTITAINTGSFATTGSNSFNGNQTITGSLTAGSLTASGSISLNGVSVTRGPGNNNVGIGVNILQNAVSGGNVALGTDALRDNTSGTDNVALGNSALAANISGDRNMAIGSNTLDSNTTGTLNVAIGNATLAGLIDGSANVGIGFEALKNQTTGSNNVGIGSQTLNQNISGSGNIAFGAKAGYYETGNNNFYVNNTEYGSINADRSGSLMWGTMSTTTANQTLQINARTRFTNEVLFTTGSNQQAGTAVLDGGNPGTVTVSNSLVTANSIIMLTKQSNNHPNAGPVVVSSKGAGTFTITSNHNNDTDTVGWFIINAS